MTINDMLEQGIKIQGPVRVVYWRHPSTDLFNGEVDWFFEQLCDGWANCRVDYMFSYGGVLVIEVESPDFD